MAYPGDPEPYQIQPILSDLYAARDLLDFSSPIAPQPGHASTASSLFSSVSQLAGGLSHRAATSVGSVGMGGVGSPTQRASPERRGSPGSGSVTGAGGTTSPPPPEHSVRCVEGFGNNLYVGGSDGTVEWWVYDGSAGPSASRGWRMQHKHKLFPARPVSRIVLLPKVARVLVLSDGTLHPLSLPGLEPLPSNVMGSIRGVISVVLNDDELDLGGFDGEGASDMTVVVVKHKGIVVYRLGHRMTALKEIPLPAPTRFHALFSTFLCAALPFEGGGLTYSIIDLSDASMTEVLPVSQLPPSECTFKVNPNVVVIPGENQFLVTSYTGSNTMGVFLNGQGDPERGTMEWAEHPLSIAVESGFIIALLRNNTITIHALDNLEHPVQTIPLDPSLTTFGLSYSPYGVSIRDLNRDERLGTTRFTLLSGKLTPPNVIAAQPPSRHDTDSPDSVGLAPPEASNGDVSPNEEPPSGSGLTPPSSPKIKRPPNHPRAPSFTSSASGLGGRAPPFSTAVAETLLMGRHEVLGLTPTSVVMRLDRLCSDRRVEEAIALVNEERRKGRRGEIDADKATHSATMRFLNLYLGCHLLLETAFERAGEYLVRGKIDARLLVRLFPAYRGKLIGTTEDVEVLDGLKHVLESMGTVDDIITDFLRRHSAEKEPVSDEDLRLDDLRVALYDSAKSMLTEYLRKTRVSRRKNGTPRSGDARKIDIVVDTTLAKLLSDEGATNELLALLAAPNDVVLAELEPFLASKKYVLATVMRQQKRTERVLEILKEIAEDTTPDPLCTDPVGEIVRELENVRNPELLRQYTLWLVKRNPEQGLNMLMSHGDKLKLDDSQVIEDLRGVDPEAANRYLEYVVVGKQSQNRELHEALLAHLLDQATEVVLDDGIKYHLEELDAEYRLLTEPQAYPVFFADIAPATPFKTLRLKLMFFLQGSSLYSLENASERLDAISVLIMERAIVLGRLGRDRRALELLARDLPDSVSAQTYCTQGGELVPLKVASAITAKVPALAEWAALNAAAANHRGSVDAATQNRLVAELLGAYMRNGDGRDTQRTRALLAAQGVHLDTDAVLAMAPPEWPLDVVTTFYTRAYRRQLHERVQWQVLKSIAAGQNLETSERYLTAIRRIPPTIVDPPPADSDGAGVDEKDTVEEKVSVLSLEGESGESGESGSEKPESEVVYDEAAYESRTYSQEPKVRTGPRTGGKTGTTQ